MLGQQYRVAIGNRGAFLFTISVGMVVNSLMALGWVSIFRFGTFNGWNVYEYLATFGVSMLVFGVVNSLSIGILALPNLVDSGGFDDMLLQPSPPLVQLATARVDITSPIDAGMGLAVVGVFIATTPSDPARLLVFLLSLVIAMVAFWCFALLLPNLVAFYIRGSTRLAFMAGVLVQDGSSSPTAIIGGWARILYLVGVPALMVAAVPVGILTYFGWKELAIGAVAVLCALRLSLWGFARSLRRYTGSNVIGAR